MILKTQKQRCRSCFFPRRLSTGLMEITKSSTFAEKKSLTLLRDTSLPVDVLGPSDIFDGTLIALLLAFTVSFLQGRRNMDDFAPSESSNLNTTSSTTVVDDDDDSLSNENIIFDADSWKEISQPESYIFYNRKLKRRKSQSSSGSSFDPEKAWVLFALLALFVPLFSVEFFFALSRQLICGSDPMNPSDWSEFLCSPAIPNIE